MKQVIISLGLVLLLLAGCRGLELANKTIEINRGDTWIR